VISSLTHLQRLEAEAIHIMREVVAEAERPVMMYSVGKDSAVMLHLARLAFYPAPPPFPLLHVDTTWKFQEMYKLRDRMAAESGMDLIVYQNPEAATRGINPFDHGALHTDMWKTEGLKQALDKYGFDAAFGGARRDEEKSRAKERIFSFRSASTAGIPRTSGPNCGTSTTPRSTRAKASGCSRSPTGPSWTSGNTSTSTNIPIVPLYFADLRPVVERDGDADHGR
jgi:sulfate adenylyltransferase subunit 2